MKRIFDKMVHVPAVYRLVSVSVVVALAALPVQRILGGEQPGGVKDLLQPGNVFAPPLLGESADGVFVENRHDIRDTRGKDRSDIVFILRGKGWDVFFRRTGVSYVFHRVVSNEDEHFPLPSAVAGRVFPLIEEYRVDVEFIRCLPSVRLEPASHALDAVKYYTRGCMGGSRQAFTRIAYRNVYEGIDIVFSTESGRLKYDIVVSPWAEPSEVSMRYSGVTAVFLDGWGNLSVETPFGVLRELAPVAFTGGVGESSRGALPYSGMGVPVAYRLEGSEVSFHVAPYPRDRTLVIDPGLVWSTYYGGGAEDWVAGIARDAGGNVYIVGRTRSLNFPVEAGYRMASAGGWDAFLVKLNALGQRVWATYLGGSDLDYGFGVAVDATGGPVICGWTKSDDFPVLHAAQTARAGDLDAFVAAFRSDGTLRWATYCGGSLDDHAMSVAADPVGGIVVTGWTLSIDFPTVSPFQATQAGFSDMIVVKYDTLGNVLWSTYFGGSGLDEAWDAAVAPSGTVYVCGRTGSTDFPAAGAAQPAPAGNVDACSVALTAGGTRLWATYFGGGKDECAYAVACDAAGNVFCTGSTDSDDLPILNAFQKKRALFLDAWVAKYSPGGSLQWSTYYGGNSSDIPADAACDPAGNVIIAGSSGSTSLPLLNAPMQKREGDDAFIARFSGNGTLLFAAFVGGGNNEGATGVTWGGGQSAVMTGTTNSM
ncbi:MAG: SBBP repeat-containing protein, partial [Bacteroidota bacterium]|nr:SBBP repeat-containing protein [Bacteroidota bacterium]